MARVFGVERLYGFSPEDLETRLTDLEASGKTIFEVLPFTSIAPVDDIGYWGVDIVYFDVVGEAVADTGFIRTTTISATATLISPASPDRKGVRIVNDSGSLIYVGFAPTVSTTAYSLRLPANAESEGPLAGYTGPIYAIRASGTSVVHVTEFT